MASERNIPEEALADFKVALVAGLLSRSDEENAAWALRQAYIAFGTTLITAAKLKIDTTSMEGSDAAKFDALLGLKLKSFKSVVALSLGYRDAESDVFSTFKKVRLPLADFATFIE
ncbi:hypothetical protein HH214_10290 [Mucilaginibacter robiniae]|uniref:Nitroreductase domain-containing protein n=1 Tax=Mucilaginibacter robiniae TaxID=2728022 RepID=A0A7L5E788_9SPHI|nr:nitroreductase family protein [Mucilaginibacter robiniae]QJD96226.1 hypothetical protein HH214_10290 [Mucilaginibacter robiniae]